MTATRISLKGVTREAWLDLRRTGIGGSEAGAVMGVSEWDSWLSVWADKRKLTPPKEENEDLLFGTLMEPVIRGWMRGLLAAEFNGEVRIEKPGFMYRSERWPWAIVNLDGRIFTSSRGKGILEIKTADRSQAPKWKEGELPDVYFWQAQHSMGVMGDEWERVACLLGKKLIHRLVPRHQDRIEELMAKEQQLWKMVERNTMPAPSGLDCDDQVLEALYGAGIEDSVVTVPDDLVKSYIYWRGVETGAEKEKKKAAQELKVIMGTATRGESLQGNASWSRFKKGHFKIEQLRKDLPEIAARYTEQLPSERFTVIEPKGKENK